MAWLIFATRSAEIVLRCCDPGRHAAAAPQIHETRSDFANAARGSAVC